MASPEPSSLRDYINSVAYGDQSWRSRSKCRDSSPQIVEMFTCDEQASFELFGEQVSGYHIQQYLVTEYCHTCPVQWECARHAVQHEMDDRYTGAWAMLRRDLRWLAQRDDALGFIDAAKVAEVPISVAVRDARAAVQ